VTITFQQDEDVPVQVARRIRETASGFNSTYFLNGRPTTLTEVHEVLGQSNISPGCYNVMMQGDVAGIVNMSGTERRKILDEMAGVAEFDRKIDQAQKELDATGANIERNHILLAEIQTRRTQLAEEREQALKYQQLKDQKTHLEGQQVLSRYLTAKGELHRLEGLLADTRKQKAERDRELGEATLGVQQTQAQLQALSEAVKRKGEDQQLAIHRQIEGLKGHIARKQDSIAFLTKQTEDHQANIDNMARERTRHQEKADGLTAEIALLTQQQQELDALFTAEQQRLDALEGQVDELTGGTLFTQRADIRKRLEAHTDALAALNRQKLDLEAQLRRLGEDAELRSQSRQKREALLARETVLAGDVDKLFIDKDAFEAEIRHHQKTVSESRVALNQALGQLQQLQRQLMQLEAQRKAYDEVHFGRAVDAVLNAGLPGVHGTLAQLCRVEGDTALAVEIAMGGRIQNIVVDDDRVAQQGIELLQRTRAGRATFLPLNKLNAARRLPVPPRGAGVIDFALNLIDFDGQYEDAFALALGDTLIVEDLEAARPLMRQYRMVTLDGSLLEKTGAMTGGASQQQQRSRFLAANTGRDDELERLRARVDEAEADKHRLESTLTTAELKLERAKDGLNSHLQTMAQINTALEGVRVQLKELPAAEDTAPTLDASALTTLDTEMGVHQATLAQLEAELAGVEQSLPAGVLEGLRGQIQEVKFQRDYYDTQRRNVLTDLKAKTLEKTHEDQAMQHIAERTQTLSGQIADYAKQMAAAQEEITLTQRQVTELVAQTQVLDEELKQLQAERDTVQTQLIELEKARHKVERAIQTLADQLLSFQARRRELEPTVKQLRAAVIEGGLDPDTATPPPEEAELAQQVEKLGRKMAALEPVNMRAIAEFDEVSRRETELGEKIGTLQSEQVALNEKIASYETLKRDAFQQTFEAVDGHFQTIFAELSDGIGQLTLTQPDDPLNSGLTIQAQPRGKKMQRLEAMSGGEKSLTSLAFVFALQRVTPAPFYALDEVDMNLDGLNAERLASMVKREAQSAQFIVVSLRKPMLSHSDRTVGVTQKRNGVTQVTGVKWREPAGVGG
jgi:chromosome segregation protein